MLTSKEIEAIKKRLQKQSDEDYEKGKRQAKLAAYEKKSNASMKKGASQRDIFTKGRRLPGSGFSKRG